MAKMLFDEGARVLADSGWPTTVSVALSTKPCSGAGCHVAADTLTGGFGEITGTGYVRLDVTEAAATGAGTKAWPVALFDTDAATDWPSNVKSLVFIDKVGTKLIAAVDTASTRDMSAAGSTLAATLSTSTTAS